MSKEKSPYYDWGETFSYDAKLTFVCAVRDAGKTYGLRLQFVRDYLKDGSRFVQLVRNKSHLAPVSDGYFSKIQAAGHFPGYIFKSDAKAAYIARQPEEGDKPAWELIGYFCALSNLQLEKQRTYADVYRICLDEAIIDPADQFHRYLRREYYLLTQMVDTITRETVDEEGGKVPRKHEPRIYLLANGLSMRNPYFSVMGIKKPPAWGKTWYGGKKVLLDYVKPGKVAEARYTHTVAGSLAALDKASAAGAMNNEFSDATGLFVEKKPRRAKFAFALKSAGRVMGVWEDETEGLVYVTDGAPRNCEPVYALTNRDGDFNAFLAERNERSLKYLLELYRYGLVRCDTDGTREELAQALALFGLRL